MIIKSTTKSRFVAVGLLNTAVDFIVLFTLVWIGLPRVAANFASTTAAFITSFFGNKSYTFRFQDKPNRKQLFRFVIVTLFSIWVIATGIISLAAPIFDTIVHNNYWSLLIAKVIATAASLVWNYLMYSRFVFKQT